MARIVAKFGGTSVANIECIEKAADKIAEEVERGNQVAVVVSAMSGVTNQLVQYCEDVSSMYDAREYDAIVSSGEQITSGLMALALQKRGIMARSWQGWQIPILCDDLHGKARIIDIQTNEFEKRIAENEVAVMAGFQGITKKGRIATLGRGGSDTSAVALAAAIHADRCDIYTDVDGVYTADPRIVSNARKIDKISYEEMLELASLGAKVLQTRSVEMAMKRNVPLQVLSTFKGTVGSDLKGTIVTQEENIVEQHIVNGIAHSKDDAKVTVFSVPDKPGVAAEIMGPLAESGVNVDMIIQNISPNGEATDMTFTVPRSDLNRAIEVLANSEVTKDCQIGTANNVCKISVVGIGMKSHSGVAQTMFKALADKGINIQAITTSEIKISVLVDEDYTELAVRALHSAYGLEK